MENNEVLLTCDIDRGELIEAADHLNRALILIIEVNDSVGIGIVDFMQVVEKLDDAWNEINKSRIYTQDDASLEDLLIPAMGLVNDARMMIESLVAWKLGLTRSGRISILASIRGAVADGIGPGITQIESCIDELRQ